MSLARPIFLSIPESRDEYGIGHITRQCVLVNFLRNIGIEAYLVLPNQLPNRNFFLGKLLINRLDQKYLLSYSDVENKLKENKFKPRFIIDSYYFQDILNVFDLDIEKIILFDDLGFMNEFHNLYSLVVPNICLPEQIDILRLAGAKNLIFGSDAILIPSEFNLKKDVKLDLARKKRNRLKTVDKNRALKIIIGFGGSDMILDRYIDVIQEKIFILYQRVNSVEISCFGQTSSKILKKLGLKHINIGWLDPVGLKKLYSQSDLYIGSIGYSMWERASMLVPSFVLPITDNQIPYLRVGEELNIHKDISSLDNNWNEIANELLNGAFDLNISCNAFTCFKDIDL